MVWTKMLLKMTLVSGLAGGFIVFAPPANAVNSRTSCYQNIDKWEDKLDRDTYRHGSGSWRARHDRHELAEARQSCQRQYGNNWRPYRYSYAASSRTSCYQNVDKWEDKLDRDIYRHGSHSWQARHDRHELAEARQSCQRR